MHVSNKNIQTYVLLETVASTHMIYVSHTFYLYDTERSNTCTWIATGRCGTTYVSNRRVSQKGRLCSQENDTNKSQSQDPPANDDKW